MGIDQSLNMLYIAKRKGVTVVQALGEYPTYVRGTISFKPEGWEMVGEPKCNIKDMIFVCLRAVKEKTTFKNEKKKQK